MKTPEEIAAIMKSFPTGRDDKLVRTAELGIEEGRRQILKQITEECPSRSKDTPNGNFTTFLVDDDFIEKNWGKEETANSRRNSSKKHA